LLENAIVDGKMFEKHGQNLLVNLMLLYPNIKLVKIIIKLVKIIIKRNVITLINIKTTKQDAITLIKEEEEEM